MENIQKLPLVFMNPLYMNIENGIGDYLNTGHIEYKRSQRLFFLSLDIPPFLSELCIIREWDKFFKFKQVCYPFIAYICSYQAGEFPVDLPQPDPLAYAVGLIRELTRIELMKIPE